MFGSVRVVSILILRALRLARLADAFVGPKAPELMDFRDPRELTELASLVCARLWRRPRALADVVDSLEVAGFWPFKRDTSLLRRAEAPLVRSEILLS